MYLKRIVSVSLLFVLLLVISCTPDKASRPVQGVTTPIPVRQISQESWEIRWERTLQAAQKEGKVVIYASSVAPALKDSLKVVKQKFGLDLDVIGGRGSELRGKLVQERTNGIFLVDIFISGANTIFGVVKSSGAAEPMEPALMLPEVLDSKLWYNGELPWLDEEKKVFSMYQYPVNIVTVNSDMVKPDEIKSYYDLLEPKWRGKVLLNDPTVTGIGFNSFSALVLNKALDLDFFRQLASHQNPILRDQRLQVDWLARGRYPVALWARSVHVAEYQQAGAPVAYAYPKEGTHLSTDGGNVVLVNKAPHPNAARIFLNWLLSKEGQTFMQEGLLQQSAREDIPTKSIGTESLRQTGKKYLIDPNDSERWVLEEQSKYLEMAQQIFGPLLR